MWRFLPFTFLAASWPRTPDISVVLTDWLSKIAALGSGFLPYAILSSVLSEAFIRSQSPVSLQRRNSGRQFSTVEIRGVTFAMHNPNVVNKRWRSPFLDRNELFFYPYSFWDMGNEA